MTNLYPLKFNSLLKEQIWGGDTIAKLKKREEHSTPVGESWEISGMEGDNTTVSNGFLAGNEINELIEIYMGELLGDEVYQRYGEEFPLLIKILDVQEPLSLQLHPDDLTAMERHNSYGKSECWYVVEAAPSAQLYLGLNRTVTAQELYNQCQDGSIEQSLNLITPKKGDIITIPPGVIHSAKGGLLMVEIQQLSDITYRIYDWEREKSENPRELHLDLAIDTINYSPIAAEALLSIDGRGATEHFSIELLDAREESVREYSSYIKEQFDLFYILDGEATISYNEGEVKAEGWETVLIPASLGDYTLSHSGKVLKIDLI